MMTPNYAALAEFRYYLRTFLRLSEAEAKRHDLEPQQHQLLLAVKGAQCDATLGYLAERLQLHHNSVVGLVDRLEARGLVLRSKDSEDHRRVNVLLTPASESILSDLSWFHQREIALAAPSLLTTLAAILESANQPRDPAEDGSERTQRHD